MDVFWSQDLAKHLVNSCCRPCSFGIDSHPCIGGGALDIQVEKAAAAIAIFSKTSDVTCNLFSGHSFFTLVAFTFLHSISEKHDKEFSFMKAAKS
jgi:hypothetical protein